MTGMLKFGSGCYNVKEVEVIKEPGKYLQRCLQTTVILLDGSQHEFEIEVFSRFINFIKQTHLQRHARGQHLLDRVFDYLELIEKDYFGLQFVDVASDSDNERMRWLDASKSVRKQMKCALLQLFDNFHVFSVGPPYLLYLRVKFYVSDPAKLQEEYTRYHFYLQVRKDLADGKLRCSPSSAAMLGSYATQCNEFSDGKTCSLKSTLS